MTLPAPRNDPILTIKAKALWMRRSAFGMVHAAQMGHPGGDFSAIDILATRYFGVLRYDPKRPDWPDRDRVIRSKRHATGALYTALCAAGYFPEDWLASHMQPRSLRNGHPNRNYLPGVETNTGPPGHGFPVAVGVAIAGAISARSCRTFVLTGDANSRKARTGKRRWYRATANRTICR